MGWAAIVWRCRGSATTENLSKRLWWQGTNGLELTNTTGGNYLRPKDGSIVPSTATDALMAGILPRHSGRVYLLSRRSLYWEHLVRAIVQNDLAFRLTENDGMAALMKHVLPPRLKAVVSHRQLLAPEPYTILPSTTRLCLLQFMVTPFLWAFKAYSLLPLHYVRGDYGNNPGFLMHPVGTQGRISGTSTLTMKEKDITSQPPWNNFVAL
ncbi:hypothetical protein C8F04DRAFT_1347073 [Mycena alexandri]|uniref:Uncharacterized protein n=1 Tax=Mycena alexandri TaxID=1745969 RepID=A0AAD6SVJ6_9AGAR|nr:hypothetical protein C8F04DRAFT_1347073 [Mycena alexandri]